MSDFNFNAFLDSIPAEAWKEIILPGETDDVELEVALVENGPDGISICFRLGKGKVKVFGAGLVAQLCASIDTSARPAIDGAKSARVN